MDIAFYWTECLLFICLWNLRSLLLFKHTIYAEARDVCADETREKSVGIYKNTENLFVGCYAFNY